MVGAAIVGMEVSVVVVAASSLALSYGAPFFFTTPVGIYGIDLGLETVHCFNKTLEFSGLAGCSVFLLVTVICSMFCNDVLVFDFSKG